MGLHIKEIVYHFDVTSFDLTPICFTCPFLCNLCFDSRRLETRLTINYHNHFVFSEIMTFLAGVDCTEQVLLMVSL